LELLKDAEIETHGEIYLIL